MKMEIPVDPPDINRSEKDFTVIDGRIVSGFRSIKGINDTAADAIISGREKWPHRDFMDFLIRTDLRNIGKREIETLIDSGAFDSFGECRESLRKFLEEMVLP
jgi:DNA polymerase-3 subunit alpha